MGGRDERATVESAVLRELLEGLVIDDGKGNVAKGVAESWSISEDGQVYTFKIRGNAVWSNGDPVTAGDFVYSIRRGLSPAAAPQILRQMAGALGANGRDYYRRHGYRLSQTYMVKNV